VRRTPALNLNREGLERKQGAGGTDLLCPPFAGLQLVVLVHPAEGAASGTIVAVAFAAKLVESALKKFAVDYLVAACGMIPPQCL
jgi:hypothetical protein